jgi:hypothetical protein
MPNINECKNQGDSNQLLVISCQFKAFLPHVQSWYTYTYINVPLICLVCWCSISPFLTGDDGLTGAWGCDVISLQECKYMVQQSMCDVNPKTHTKSMNPDMSCSDKQVRKFGPGEKDLR